MQRVPNLYPKKLPYTWTIFLSIETECQPLIRLLTDLGFISRDINLVSVQYKQQSPGSQDSPICLY